MYKPEPIITHTDKIQLTEKEGEEFSLTFVNCPQTEENFVSVLDFMRNRNSILLSKKAHEWHLKLDKRHKTILWPSMNGAKNNKSLKEQMSSILVLGRQCAEISLR